MFRPSSCVLASLLAVSISVGSSSHAAPYRPSDDHTILERLPTGTFTEATAELRRLRSQLAATPDNLDLAIKTATLAIKVSRIESDPRYIGYAQATLAPWWPLAHPPTPVLILRATIKQSLHEFGAALKDLDDALARNPRQAQARLTRATVYRVLGRYAEARRDCLQLLRVASELVTATCAAEVSSLTGQLNGAFALLRQTLERYSDGPPEERLWAMTALAEMAGRSGQPQLAEQYYRAALVLEPRDSYLLSSYADFLLNENRAEAVVALLHDKVRADALLLRLTLAELRLNRPLASDHVRALGARFEAAHLRGDVLHRREEARFALECLRQPDRALALARVNWTVQRESADARILLESARAAGDRSAAQPALFWMRDNHVIDGALDRIAMDFYKD